VSCMGSDHAVDHSSREVSSRREDRAATPRTPRWRRSGHYKQINGSTTRPSSIQEPNSGPYCSSTSRSSTTAELQRQACDGVLDYGEAGSMRPRRVATSEANAFRPLLVIKTEVRSRFPSWLMIFTKLAASSTPRYLDKVPSVRCNVSRRNRNCEDEASTKMARMPRRLRWKTGSSSDWSASLIAAGPVSQHKPLRPAR
jgi:hypothetical protein